VTDHVIPRSHIIPDGNDNTFDIGSDTYRIRNIHVATELLLYGGRLTGIKIVTTAPAVGDLKDGEVVFLYDTVTPLYRLYVRLNGTLFYVNLTAA